MNDVIYRKVMTVPEAGAQLGLGRNASYAAAKREGRFSGSHSSGHK